ncbi:MAG: bifunctional enoyl-CoA hydratase/phosphate acetyltransferase [Bacteroidales bacterium]|nr:bifunctional enoyl-CoA hydratase/phosphate acetyltransferase [Bacteroidales bacterium]
MLTKISEIHALAKKTKKKTVALAAAQDENALIAAMKAREAGIVDTILVGDETKIKKIAAENKLDIFGVKIIHEPDLTQACTTAVKLIRDKKAEILMKGNVSTAIILREVLNKDYGLRSGELLSHFAIFELEKYHKLLGLSDAGMNINPDIMGKAAIIQNAVNFMRMLGLEKPKVAVLSAIELVNPEMPSNVDAAIVSKMAQRGQIKNCIIDGPLALDNAVSAESAKHKNIVSDVAGDADILIAQDIDAANVIYKAFLFLQNGKCAAVIVGATAPIVLTSRSDSDETKLNSIALAAAAK